MPKDAVAKPGSTVPKKKKKKSADFISGLKVWKSRYDDLLKALGSKKPKPARPGK